MQEQFCNNTVIFWESIKNPAIVAALISAIVTGAINLRNGKIAQLSTLYNHKYEFWLDFSKKFFRIKPFLEHMINPINYLMGVITFQDEHAIIQNFREWLNKWKDFYNIVVENEKIYMEPEEIDALMLNSFFTAFENNLNNLDIKKNLGNGNTFTISQESINNILTEAKEIFENYLRQETRLFFQYLNVLNKHSKKDRKKYKNIQKNLSYDEMKSIVNELSNKAFLELIKINLADTTEKIEKIASIEPMHKKIFFKIKKWWRKHKPNDFKKWINVPHNKQAHIRKPFKISLIICLLLLVATWLWFLSGNLYNFLTHILVIIIMILLQYLFNLTLIDK